MDETHVHLLLNHFPIIGTLIGAAVMLWGHLWPWHGLATTAGRSGIHNYARHSSRLSKAGNMSMRGGSICTGKNVTIWCIRKQIRLTILPGIKHSVRVLLHALGLLSVKLATLIVLFLLCLYLLYHLIHDVFSEGDTAFDARMFAFANKLASPGMTHFMRHVSFFGSDEYLIVAMALAVLVFSFYRSMQWNSLRMLLISFTVSVLNAYLKHQFARPRPDLGLLEASGLSFPSGHAMIGGVFYGLLIYITWTTVKSKGRRWVVSALLTLLILLIGFSRVYLRMHYATDVVAGYLIGILWLVLSLYLMARVERFYKNKYQSPQRGTQT